LSDLIVAPDPVVIEPPDSAALTKRFREEEVERGRRSLFYFLTGVLGLTDPHPRTGASRLSGIHSDLCDFLTGRAPHHPWNRSMVCAFRGAAKSTICRIYFLWRCIYVKNYSFLIVSNSATNAQQNHYLPLMRLFTESRRSEYLRWLYADRIPTGDPNWANSERFSFKRDDPQAGPSCFYLGTESKFEGIHPNGILGDDLEGSEAEESRKANVTAYQVYQRMLPLPREPEESQVCLTLTPWGADPLAWKLRDLYKWNSIADNATSPLKIWWVPAEGPNGEPAWPEKIGKQFLDSIRSEPIYKTQYMLHRRSVTESLFDMERILDSTYEWIGPTKDQIAYKGFKFDPDSLGEDGFVRPELVDSVVRLAQCRYFLHVDPLHKSAEQKKNIAYARPAKAAIAVCAVAPDFHVFLLDYYIGDVGLDVQVMELFRLYKLYAPYVVTFEDIGAQSWLTSYVKMCETQSPHWQNPRSAGIIPGIPAMQLPRLSTRLKAGEKDVQSKEFLYREALSPWLHHGVLHVRRDQHEVLQQLENVSDDRQSVDLLDCLAQGASGLADEDGRSVWQPPLGEKYQRQWASRRQYVETFVRKDRVARRTGVVAPPWGR
jgi:hypothetical protein